MFRYAMLTDFIGRLKHTFVTRFHQGECWVVLFAFQSVTTP